MEKGHTETGTYLYLYEVRERLTTSLVTATKKAGQKAPAKPHILQPAPRGPTEVLRTALSLSLCMPLTTVLSLLTLLQGWLPTTAPTTGSTIAITAHTTVASKVSRRCLFSQSHCSCPYVTSPELITYFLYNSSLPFINLANNSVYYYPVQASSFYGLRKDGRLHRPSRIGAGDRSRH